MHAATLGRELGVKRTVDPAHPGLFSAWGMLTARPRIDLRQTRCSTARRRERLQPRRRAFRRLDAEAADASSALVADAARLRPPDRDALRRPGAHRRDAIRPRRPGVDALLEAFHAAHEQTYTFRLADTDVRARDLPPRRRDSTRRASACLRSTAAGTVESALIGDLEVHDGETGTALAHVYDRDRLPAGAVLRRAGPHRGADQHHPGACRPAATVDRFGLMVIEEAR